MNKVCAYLLYLLFAVALLIAPLRIEAWPVLYTGVLVGFVVGRATHALTDHTHTGGSWDV